MMSFEDQVLNEEFRNAYQNMKAPEDLKNDTLKRMLAEEKHLEKEDGNSRKVKRTVWYYGTAVVALCAAILVIAVLRSEGISYITPMEEDVFYDEVALENGMIRFLPDRVVISISPNAGQAVIGQGESVSGSFDEEEAELIEVTESESGGELKFLTERTAFAPEIDEDSWSYIGEQKIYVSVLKSEDMRYQAVYEKNNKIYEVIGINVTQKEFIDYLYQKIKKEK
ncbi:MAG: hypothetical protein HDQ97_05775 [Lachnospiraceae bacterium]|nr:hypothetical protein [Lachnospiraceae bacterium]